MGIRERILNVLKKNIVPGYMGPTFANFYHNCKRFSVTSVEKMFTLHNAVKYVIRNNIKGDFVECGVFMGGSCMMMALTLKKLKAFRKIWMYDTYSGMPMPENRDKKFQSNVNYANFWKKNETGKGNKWLYHSLEKVRKNMASTEYPLDRVVFVKGMVEETIPRSIPQKISILRLDTDLYNSTKHELQHLFPRLSKGGVLIADDYDSWKGCREAFEEYFKSKKIKIFLIGDSSSGRTGIKQ